MYQQCFHRYGTTAQCKDPRRVKKVKMEAMNVMLLFVHVTGKALIVSSQTALSPKFLFPVTNFTLETFFRISTSTFSSMLQTGKVKSQNLVGLAFIMLS